MDLQLSTRQEGGVAVVSAAGEIDVFTAPDLDAHLASLQSSGSTNLVVDLTRVAFLDSTGLGVLVKALKRARDVRGWIRLVVTTDRIRKIFDITGLDASMPIFDTVEAAVAN